MHRIEAIQLPPDAHLIQIGRDAWLARTITAAHEQSERAEEALAERFQQLIQPRDDTDKLTRLQALIDGAVHLREQLRCLLAAEQARREIERTG